MIPNFLKDYPDIKEKLDLSFHRSFGPILESTFLIDSNHAHGLGAHRFLTGWIGYVGSIPVCWGSKRQGYISPSTYATEFSAFCTATEDART